MVSLKKWQQTVEAALGLKFVNGQAVNIRTRITEAIATDVSPASRDVIETLMQDDAVDQAVAVVLTRGELTALRALAERDIVEGYDRSIVDLERNQADDSLLISYDDGTQESIGDVAVPTIAVDDTLSSTSDNPVANRVIFGALNRKANADDTEGQHKSLLAHVKELAGQLASEVVRARKAEDSKVGPDALHKAVTLHPESSKALALNGQELQLQLPDDMFIKKVERIEGSKVVRILLADVAQTPVEIDLASMVPVATAGILEGAGTDLSKLKLKDGVNDGDTLRWNASASSWEIVSAQEGGGGKKIKKAAPETTPAPL